MNILEEITECYGCGACSNACPVSAIGMNFNEKGFLVPHINIQLCIECGRCQQVCPRINPCYENLDKPDCYAFLANDEIRKKSSTAGAFTCLANYVLSRDGYVVGASFDENFMVNHIVINNEADLEKLRGSKYAQSNTCFTYQKTKELLDNDQYVLYSGCPCQIAGLKSYLGKEYAKLITVDLVCEGTPSSLVLHKYLDEKYGIDKIKDVKFRFLEKWAYGFIVKLNDGRTIVEKGVNSPYMANFVSENMNKDACYSCQFDTIPRQGDITIGDFWHVDKLDASLHDGMGTGVVLINNEKGKQIFSELSGVKTYKEFTVEETVESGVIYINRGPRKGKKYDDFWKLLKTKGVTYAIDHGKKDYDIGLVVAYLDNFGNIITNYALYMYLKQLGYSVCFINEADKHNLLTSNRHKAFAKSYNYDLSNDIYSSISEINEYIDTFIVGADQLWNYKLYKNLTDYFYLNWITDYHHKIAIGTAIGYEKADFPLEITGKVKNALKEFDLILTREDYSVNTLKKFDANVEWVSDPVFLCDKTVYTTIVSKSKLELDNFVFAYWLYPDEAKKELMFKVAKEKGVDLLYFSKPHVKGCLYNAKGEAISDVTAYVCNWIYGLMNCSYVLTDSFHGGCLSILFNKPFICVKNREKDRYDVLKRRFNLHNCIVDSIDLAKVSLLDEKIDWETINSSIQSEKDALSTKLISLIDEPKYMMPTKQNTSFSLTNKENVIGDNIIWHRSNVICKLLADDSILVQNNSEEFDATIVYGGRGTGGYFSNKMEPGKSYIANVQVELFEDLIQPTSDRALTIRVDIKYPNKIHWGAFYSQAAPQTQGIYNLEVEFTVPNDAIGCWVSLQLGAGHKSGAIWRKFQITQKNSVLENIYNLDDDEISLENWNGVSFKYQDTVYSEEEILYLESLLRKQNKVVPLFIKEYILGLNDATLDGDRLLKDVISDNKKIGIEYPGYFDVKGNNYLKKIILKQWVIKQYEIQKKVPFKLPCQIEGKIPVFVYWNNGISEAPYVVKQCVEELKERLPENYRLHIIDDNNINSYVKIPEWMYEVKQTKVAHFSDYLRLLLLYTYGGAWIDSTVLVSKKFTDWMVDIESKLGSGIVIPSYNMSKSIIGNWFIFVKEKYNYCISWMLRMLNVFWMKFNDVPDYFFFHVIFQIMWIDEKFYKLWSESPVIDAQKGVFVFKHQYDASVNYDMSQVLNCSPIHKLTYKNFDKMKLGMLMSDFINYVTSE